MRLRALAAALAAATILGGCGPDRADERRPAPRPAAPAHVPLGAGDLMPEADARPEALKDERPDEVPRAELERGLDATDRMGERLEPQPVGGAQNYSCRQDFSGRVWSSYSRKPTELVLHYTVSPNRPGWGDVLGIHSYFKRTRVASSDRIVDFEAHCLQMVPIRECKAWTQGGANGATCASYEIIATGRESRAAWLASPLIKRGILASIVRDDARRCGIPLRRVDPRGCVFPPGVTDHNALECGNDHTDVAPAFPWDVFMRQLRGPAALSCTEKVQHALNRHPHHLPRPRPPLDVDGIRGPKTKAAVQRFQRAHGLSPGGKPGPKTRAALGVKC